LEENQVKTIFRYLFQIADQKIGPVDMAEMKPRKPAYTYSHDEIKITGKMADGRSYELHLEIREKEAE
jgi:hypothetical protein